MRNLRKRFEVFLRIDEKYGLATQARARIAYATGVIFVASQLLNMVSMAYIYEGWTYQHVISVASLLVFVTVTLSIRYTKSATFFGLAYSLMVLGGIGVSAIFVPSPEFPPYGINTPLLPVLCAASAFIAFIGTRVVSAAYIIFSLILIFFMYNTTFTLGVVGVDAMLAWQRMVQSMIAILLVGPICTIIAENVFRNLTKLEGAVTRARSAETARTNFLATMSHEIRTPLHGILGLSDMLSRADLPKQHGQHAKLITVSANNLMEIIDEVLDMARLEDGSVTVKAEPFKPAVLLQDICDLFAVKASQNDLWIGTNIDARIPDTLIGDNTHLRQVISNLVGNALKFTQSGGVRIGARLAAIKDGAASVQFYVQDTGVGIAPEDQEDVFERFKQSDSAKTTTTKGTGLGLSICRELTDMMGSTLELQSASGQGSVFYFTLTLPIDVAQSLSSAA